MTFDARTIKQFPPGTHLVPNAPGLRLEVSASRRTWIYRYKSPIDERMRQIKIGEWPQMSTAAATAEWEKLRAARDGGKDPAVEKRARPGEHTVTVKKLCAAYLANRVEVKRKAAGAAEVAREFRTMLGPLATLEVEAVTRAQAATLIESHSHSPVMARKLRAELAGAWSYGLDMGLIDSNTPNHWREVLRGELHSKGRMRKGKRVTNLRDLSGPEITEVLQWMAVLKREGVGMTLHDAMILYLWTGTRGVEICAMERRELKEEADGLLWWTISEHKQKITKKKSAKVVDLRVPLFGRAADVVRSRLKTVEGSFLFPSARNGHVSQDLLKGTLHYFQPYSKKRPGSVRPRVPVTVEPWTLHDLRRTVRTQLAGLGCPDEIGEAVLGHVPKGVLGTYNRHSYDNERREWLGKWNERLVGLEPVGERDMLAA